MGKSFFKPLCLKLIQNPIGGIYYLHTMINFCLGIILIIFLQNCKITASIKSVVVVICFLFNSHTFSELMGILNDLILPKEKN